MSDIEILSTMTDLVDQIEDNELRTGMQFIVGSVGLVFASDVEAHRLALLNGATAMHTVPPLTADQIRKTLGIMEEESEGLEN